MTIKSSQHLGTSADETGSITLPEWLGNTGFCQKGFISQVFGGGYFMAS